MFNKFKEIPGSKEILDLLKSECPDFKFPEKFSVYNLKIEGTKDLELGAELLERKKTEGLINPRFYSNLLVYATQGQITGISISGNGAKIVATNTTRSLVEITSDNNYFVEKTSGHKPDIHANYGAFFEIRFT